MRLILNNEFNEQIGFTLIELMIMVAIISVLAAIAIPSYYSNISKPRSNACLSEAKSYSNDVFTLIND